MTERLQTSSDQQPPDSGKPVQAWEVASWIEGMIVGAATFFGRLCKTVWLMTVAPRRIVEVIERQQAGDHKLTHPFTFLFVLILPVTVAFEHWGLPATIERVLDLETMTTTLPLVAVLTDLQALTLQRFFFQTAPSAMLVVAMACLFARIWGDRQSLVSSPLIAVMNYVVGYRLFLRVCETLVLLVILQIIPHVVHGTLAVQFASLGLILCLFLATVLLTIYTLFFAGWVTMYAALRRWGKGWMVRHRISAALTAGATCFILYLPSVTIPALVPMAAMQAMAGGTQDVVTLASPSMPAELEASDDEPVTMRLVEAEQVVFDGRSHLLVAPLVVRNRADHAMVVRAPQQVLTVDSHRPLYCRLVGREAFDAFDLLAPGDTVLWQLMIYLPQGESVDLPQQTGLAYTVRYLPVGAAEGADYSEIEMRTELQAAVQQRLADITARRRAVASDSREPVVR